MVYNNVYIQSIQLAKHISQNYGSFNQTELNMYSNITFNKGWLYVSNDIFGYKLLKFIVLICALVLA